VTTVLQARLPRHDHDAHAAVDLGHSHGDRIGPPGLSRLVRIRIMMTWDSLAAPASSCRRAQQIGHIPNAGNATM